jgi:type I restriction enzyme R subunit
VKLNRLQEARVAAAQAPSPVERQTKEFIIEFVLMKYIETGVEEELDQENSLSLTNKYQSLEDAKAYWVKSRTSVSCL